MNILPQLNSSEPSEQSRLKSHTFLLATHSPCAPHTNCPSGQLWGCTVGAGVVTAGVVLFGFGSSPGPTDGREQKSIAELENKGGWRPKALTFFFFCYRKNHFTVIWVAVQEGEVIDGNVSIKIISNSTFNQNLAKRANQSKHKKIRLHTQFKIRLYQLLKFFPSSKFLCQVSPKLLVSS